jgi:hypothetical protein
MVPPLVDVPPPRPVVLVLCGYQEHGKTTAALWLERQYGFHRTSFADPIRAMLVAQGCPSLRLRSGQWKNVPCDELCGMSPRAAMESLGDWGRDRSPDFWIRAWDRTLPQAGLIVVDDARYDLEAAAALGVARRRDAAFVMIEVFRPDHPCGTSHGSNRVPVAPTGVVADHVINDGTVDVLGARVAAVLRERGVSP